MTYKLNIMQLPEWAWAGLGFIMLALYKAVTFFVKDLFADNKGQSKELDEVKDLIVRSQNKVLLEIGQMENNISKVQISLDNLETTTRRDFERLESDMQIAKVDLIAAGRSIAEANRQIAIVNEWKKNIDNKVK